MDAAALVLINGLPGSGKSTIAREFAAQRPSAVALDIDTLRSMIGCWRADPQAGGLQARAMAISIARDQLAAGHPVVIPQLLAKVDFIAELSDLAAGLDVAFVETVLDTPLALCRKRFAARAANPATAAEADAQVWLGTASADWHQLDQQLNALVVSRPWTVKLAADSPRALKQLHTALGEPR